MAAIYQTSIANMYIKKKQTLERNKESQNAALLDLQNEMKSLKSLFISRASSNALEQASSAPATPAAPAYNTTVSSVPTTPVAAPSPTDGLSSRLSATINSSGARAGIPAWQMAASQASSANNTTTTTTTPAAETEATNSK